MKLPAQRFQDSMEHILSELERIDLLVQAQVQRARDHYQIDSAFQGLLISEQEVDALFAQPIGMPKWAHAESPTDDVHDAVERLRAEIQTRQEETTRQGGVLRLAELARLRLRPTSREWVNRGPG